MKADFARVTFDSAKHFRRVLMQQGRVQLDADWNEQVAILLHHLQTLTADLIGPYAGPGDGFTIAERRDANSKVIPYDFSILPGHYYVNGLLCENGRKNDPPTAYTDQPYYPLPENERLQKPSSGVRNYLVYLDVWERLITAVEDDSIREVALGGADTAARSQLVWQVKVWDAGDTDLSGLTCETIDDPNSNPTSPWKVLLNDVEPVQRGQLTAKAMEATDVNSKDPCITPPEARYRGPENQLYRVEIHNSGAAGEVTFKWSRENGAVVFSVSSVSGNQVVVTGLGRDARRTLRVGDWVEYVYDDYVLQNWAGQIFQVQAVNAVDMTVTLDHSPQPFPAEQHPLLRRWDHKAGNPQAGGLELRHGAALIVEPKDADSDEKGWLNLEDGIQIRFQPGGNYRTGDYWLIAARTATGDVEWPKQKDEHDKLHRAALRPHGVEHHYAPLAGITIGESGKIAITDYRCKFEPLGICPT